MDSLFAFKIDGGVIMGADMESRRSIMIYNHNEDKISELSDTKVMGVVGEFSDTDAFVDYIDKNRALFELRNSHPMSTKSLANFIKTELSTAIRRRPYNANCLLAGMDIEIPSLYRCDYMGTLSEVEFGAFGYCSHFILSLFDCHWKEGMSVEEGAELAKKCIDEIQLRFLPNSTKFKLKHISSAGIVTL
eukprot:TRINITY_DN863_c0_g1_i1.p1 TRINITY_DN863_c0_g1~~TRINITY_DN863_c0_g1_i1.p1  ORF type:complete len:190 (+),score=33.40 TRINITY_DN863_c0_g1_i1:118-687(+)